MPTLDITEYNELAVAGRGLMVMAGQEPAVRTQQVNINVTSNQSQALSDVTRFIRLHAEVPCRVAVGDNPTASLASMRMVAGGTEYLGVSPSLKIAVIASA
jgi:hypothetical protein